MGNVRTIELSPAERSALEKGMRTGKGHTFRQRCHLVLLKSERRTDEEVGQILGISRLSVLKWLKRWKAQGIEGLKTRPGRGRRRILEPKDEAVVLAAVKNNCQRLSQAKSAIEKELEKEFSAKTLKRFLKSLVADINEFEGGPKDNQ